MSMDGSRKMLRKVSLKSLMIAAAVLVVVATATICLFGFASTKQIVIRDGEQTTEVKTSQRTAAALLRELGITLRDEDRVSLPLEQTLNNKDEIVIERAKRLTVAVDGENKELYSCEPTVKAVLQEKGIEMGEFDEIEPVLETEITENLAVTIHRVSVEYLDFEVEIPFETKRIANASQPKEYSKVLQEGKNGMKKVTYKNVTKDGVEVISDIVAEEILTQPVTQEVEYGSKVVKEIQTSRGNLSYSRVLSMSATAYDASPASNGIYAGRTATGRVPTRGIVAVDPSVIPLNSRLYIESSDGGKSWVYGYAIAGDTGGAIKGNKIDLCFDSYAECMRFGRKSATVYVLN